MAEQQFRIGLYQSIFILKPTTVLPVGSHEFRIFPEGNSLLSTIFVDSAGGTVSAEWFDFGAGKEELPASRTSLGLHGPHSASETSRIVVTRIHSNARVVVTVTGGPAAIGLYATVVSDFPLNANILDGQTGNLTVDGGLPIAVYDDLLNQFFLLRGTQGALIVDVDGVGEGKVISSSGVYSPGIEVSLSSGVVPIGKTWRINYAEVVARSHTRWRILLDGTRVGGGATGPANIHDRVSLPANVKATTGQTVELKLTYSSGPANLDIDSFIGYAEF